MQASHTGSGILGAWVNWGQSVVVVICVSQLLRDSAATRFRDSSSRDTFRGSDEVAAGHKKRTARWQCPNLNVGPHLDIRPL
jgi:hypothetical protein